MNPTAAVATATLHIRGLKKSYPSPDGAVVVLDGIDLDLVGGDEVAITGPSGCGKSTLLHIVGGLDTPTAGNVDVNGRSLAALDPKELAEYRSRHVGFVFQDHHLLPQCTVLENVLLPTLPVKGATRDAIERARWLLDRVGLAGRVAHRPSEISGGERQRVAIARSLINAPQLLLCDEPTGNLDRSNADRVADLLLELSAETAAILIVVTHSMEIAAKLKLRLELTEGRLVPA